MSYGQASGVKPNLELIMSNPDWMGNGPENAIWSDDNSHIFYQKKNKGNKLRSWYKLSIKDGIAKPYQNSLDIQSQKGKLSADKKFKVFTYQGDVYLKNMQDGAITRKTRTPEKESSPQFIGESLDIVFWQGNKLLKLSTNGTLDTLANIALKNPKPKKHKYQYLQKQQLKYFKSLSQAKMNRDLKDKQQKALVKKALNAHTYFLGKNNEIIGRDVSTDANFVALVLRDKTHDRGKVEIMPRYVTESGHIETQKIRTLVGQNNPANHFVVLLDLRKYQQSEVSVKKLPDIHTDRLKKIRMQAIKWHRNNGATKSEAEDLVRADATRHVYVMDLKWSPDSKNLAIQYRAIDNKDRWIATVGLDKITGKLINAVSQHQLTDKGWINWNFNRFGWLPDSRTLWYQSEQSGYSHLYLKSVNKSRVTRLTKGKWEVYVPVLSKDGKSIYFKANKKHPGIYEIYRVEVNSGKTQQLTDLGGSNEFKLSPDESRLLIMHSTITHHPEIYVKSLKENSPAKTLTQTMSKEYLDIPWVIPEIVPVPSSHVKDPIYTKVYKPKNFSKSSTRKYPAVVFVHGAGYTQNSHYGWAYYFHEMMFHTLLVNQGYIVIDMDYRGSKGYGRDWRTAIYRQMGHPEVDDLEDGVNWMVKNLNVDRKRVGIYGGSYGGFLTFMSLFRKPDLFAAGAALRPVSDWAHYNHGYTSNILNTPAIDPMAYENSSPIEFVDGLSKPLLICSGMLDDNVFFQDSVRMVQRLIELKKQNFEMAIFPMEHHAFKIASSWLNEYRRIYKLMETEVKNKK